jgi:CBS domain-containing protein
MSERVCSILGTKGSEIWSVRPQTTVYDALALLAEKDVGALPVVEGGDLAGMFSERDYARKVALMGRSSKKMLVSEVMTTPVITITPDHTIEDCMRLVTERRVRHLPVIDRGRLVGMISIGDLVNAIISSQAETIQHLSGYITGEYPR